MRGISAPEFAESGWQAGMRALVPLNLPKAGSRRE